MISLEDEIFNYSNTLADVKDFSPDYILKLNINDKFFITANHVEIEDNEWVYNIALYNEDELIDSIYCDKLQEELEDIIFFLIEEYISEFI